MALNFEHVLHLSALGDDPGVAAVEIRFGHGRGRVLVLPAVLPTYYLGLVTTALILAIPATSANLLLGYPGLAYVLGRNGVGKTTLLHSIVSFVKPGMGRILIEDLVHIRSTVRRKLEEVGTTVLE